jgi:hypothetical protein
MRIPRRSRLGTRKSGLQLNRRLLMIGYDPDQVFLRETNCRLPHRSVAPQ